MTHPRRAPLTVAGLVAGAVVAPLAGPSAPAAADEFCWTMTVSEEEAEMGVTTDVVCDEDPPAFRLATVAYAIHYDGDDAGTTPSAYFTVYGPDDCSGRTNFDVSEWWNNRISSTRYGACTNVKHFTGADLTGSYQLTTGSYGSWDPLNATLDNATSSIGYGT
jgi:hypothetical protein